MFATMKILKPIESLYKSLTVHRLTTYLIVAPIVPNSQANPLELVEGTNYVCSTISEPGICEQKCKKKIAGVTQASWARSITLWSICRVIYLRRVSAWQSAMKAAVWAIDKSAFQAKKFCFRMPIRSLRVIEEATVVLCLQACCATCSQAYREEPYLIGELHCGIHIGCQKRLKGRDMTEPPIVACSSSTGSELSVTGHADDAKVFFTLNCRLNYNSSSARYAIVDLHKTCIQQQKKKKKKKILTHRARGKICLNMKCKGDRLWLTLNACLPWSCMTSSILSLWCCIFPPTSVSELSWLVETLLLSSFLFILQSLCSLCQRKSSLRCDLAFQNSSEACWMPRKVSSLVL